MLGSYAMTPMGPVIKDHPPSWYHSKLVKQIGGGFVIFILLLILYFMSGHSDNSHGEVVSLQQSDKAPVAVNGCGWRPEPLLGICDVTKATEESQQYDNAVDCENACCANDECITFQYRTKEGCLWGGDTRLGAEKDGVPAWCEPRAPAKWMGQRIKKDGELVAGACEDGEHGWNPNELEGQCFGLGSSKTISSNTPEMCRDACCEDTNCAVWQWRKDAGCFYNKGAHNCQSANPLDFEAFKGKRKVVEGRTYSPYAYTKDFEDMAGIEYKSAVL